MYPRAIELNRKLGKGMPGTDSNGTVIEPEADLLRDLEEYKQIAEREAYNFEDQWQCVGFKETTT